MRRIRKNKRGDVGDFLTFAAVIFAVGVLFFVGNKAWSSISEKLPDVIDMNEQQNATVEKVTANFNGLDMVFALFFFGFYIAILFSVFFLDTNPGFLIFAGILLFITILVGGILSDSFTEIVENENFDDQLDVYPVTYHIMSSLPIYLIGMAVIFLIVLYASRRILG